MLKKFSNNLKSFFLKFKEINNISRRQPRFIFYSENKSYLKYGYSIIEYLSKKFPGEVYYISSDVSDKVSDLNVINAYIGQGFLLQYFFKSIKTSNLFMTLTDLNNNNIVKRNNFVKNYIYFFHGAISTTRIYTSAAFDSYDTILCNGDYQVKEIRQREKLVNLKEKKLIKSGFFYFDYLKDKIDETNDNEILVAPSWNKNRLNFINEDFEEIITNLLNSDYKVRFRPHPETIKRSKDLMESYKQKFKGKNFLFDDNSENLEAMKNAKCLITDNSGISIEYMMLFKKPVIFYSDFDKVHNESFEMFKGLVPIEDIIKDKFGYEFNKHELNEIEEIINKAVINFDKKEIDNFLNDNFYNYENTIDYFDKNFSKICN